MFITNKCGGGEGRGGGDRNEHWTKHPPVAGHHTGWMVGGQEMLFHCNPITKLNHDG